MAVWVVGGVAQWVKWKGVVERKLSSVDESESVDVDGDGDRGTGWFSSRFRGVVGSVWSSVRFPDSCKRLLVLRVSKGVRVEGCRDRVNLSDVEERCRCQKKSGRLPG